MQMIQLYLIRHCEGNANKCNLVSGDPEDGLSEFGIQQLESLKSFVELKKINFDVVYSSHWKRAIRTAKEIFGENVVVSSSLGETNSGLDSNTEHNHFVNENPSFYTSRYNKFKCGESHFEMKERVVSFFDNILKETSCKNIAIVSHAGPISVILQHVLNLDFVTYFPRFVPAHGSITKLQIDNSGKFDSMNFFSYTPQQDTLYKLFNDIRKWP